MTPHAVPLARIDVVPGEPHALCIGPEGGFSERDLAQLLAAGAVSVHLGPRVLRARTAGAAALTLLLSRASDLDEPVPAPPAA